MRICEANTRILRAKPQPYIDAMPMGFQPVMPRTDGSPQTAENRTLCRARALSKREAFVARGRGRRQAAEAGAYLRSKYADSPRKASTLYRCDADGVSAGHAPHRRIPPNRGESNSMQGAGVKQTRSVCSPRARAAAGGRSRCVFAKQIRGFSAQSFNPMQMRCRSDCSLPCPASTSPQAENPSQNSGSDWDAVSG